MIVIEHIEKRVEFSIFFAPMGIQNRRFVLPRRCIFFA